MLLRPFEQRLRGDVKSAESKLCVRLCKGCPLGVTRIAATTGVVVNPVDDPPRSTSRLTIPQGSYTHTPTVGRWQGTSCRFVGRRDEIVRTADGRSLIVRHPDDRRSGSHTRCPQCDSAGHCKSWRDSSDFERLDGENGLLLTPTIDHLFDRGFISFETDGRLLVSPVAHRPSLQRIVCVSRERVDSAQGVEVLESPSIRLISGKRVILDSTLAELYGVATRRLN